MSLLEQLRTGILGTAQQLGVDPLDLATVISYETGGKFDPTIKGPTTKWGTHRGLLQWGEPQARQYLGGDFSVPAQMKGAAAYLTDAGVKPGMGLLDLYSAVNAGRVGRYGASDAAAGGAPGTVADKVAGMAAHRQKAEALLSGAPLAGGASQPPTQGTSHAPVATAAAPEDSGLLATMKHAKSNAGGKLDSMLLSGLMNGNAEQKAPQVRFENLPRQKSPFPPLAQYVAEYLKTINKA